jgi:hypothetical protein
MFAYKLANTTKIVLKSVSYTTPFVCPVFNYKLIILFALIRPKRSISREHLITAWVGHSPCSIKIIAAIGSRERMNLRFSFEQKINFTTLLTGGRERFACRPRKMQKLQISTCAVLITQNQKHSKEIQMMRQRYLVNS